MEDKQIKWADWIRLESVHIEGDILRVALFDWASNDCSCYECLVYYIKEAGHRGEKE